MRKCEKKIMICHKTITLSHDLTSMGVMCLSSQAQLPRAFVALSKDERSVVGWLFFKMQFSTDK